MAESFSDQATTDLGVAVYNGNKAATLAALRNGGNVDALVVCEDGVHRTLLGVAAYYDHAHLIPLLVEAGAQLEQRGGRTMMAIHHAAREGRLKALKALVEAGADINTKENRFFNSTLHFATMMQHLECVRVLVEAGSDLNPKDINDYRPLHVASRTNNVPIIKYLLQSGCDREPRTVAGWTPLHVAGMSGSEEAVKTLLEYGLSLEATDNDGRTPAVLTDECGQGHMYWYFIKTFGLGATTSLSPAVKVRQSMERYDIEQFVLKWAGQSLEESHNLLRLNIPNPFDGHYQDHLGRTALHIAAENGLKDNVIALLDHGKIYPEVRTHAGQTPAQLAKAAGHEELVKLIRGKKMPLKAGEEATVLYRELLTTIADGDDVKRASDLLSRGCPTNPCGSFSTHAIALAVISNRRRILTLLVAAGAASFVRVQGLSLLQIAWFTAEVTIFIKMIVTRSMQHALEEEYRKSERWPKLQRGISGILETLHGEEPWQARWPDHLDSKGDRFFLTQRLTEAIRAKCDMTASFLLEAGAMPMFADDCYKLSPFEVALQEKNWGVAKRLGRITGCVYANDANKKLYKDCLPPEYGVKLDREIFEQELRKLMNTEEKAKDVEVQLELRKIRHLQRKLYRLYQSGEALDSSTQRLITHIGSQALIVASRSNLAQFVFLLLSTGEIGVNSKLDNMLYSSAVHQAAAYGNHNMLFMMHRMGGNINQPDRYQHTPLHLAAMFGHSTAYEQLTLLFRGDEPHSRSGTTPSQVRKNFEVYLQQYGVNSENPESSLNFEDFNNPNKALEKHLGKLNLPDLKRQSLTRCVNYKEGEAMEIQKIVIAEIKALRDRVAHLNPVFQGEVKLLGSSSDGTRLCAPDEFDFNLVIKPPVQMDLKISHLEGKMALLKGQKSELKLKPRHSKVKLFRDSNWKRSFYDAVTKSVEGYTFKDHRLSLVPPGVTRTQVGVALSLAWEGTQYPLLLIGIDFVPVLSVPWPKTVDRPYLTPGTLENVFVSSLGKGKWRFSFAGVEVETLKSLDEVERMVYLTCKNLLANLKAEPWMPKKLKNRYTYWDAQRWKLSIPDGFAMKNCFLRIVEQKRRDNIMWSEEHLHLYMEQVFSLMLGEFVDPTSKRTRRISRKIFPYYGRDFESPKVGEGVREIISFIENTEKIKSRSTQASDNEEFHGSYVTPA